MEGDYLGKLFLSHPPLNYLLLVHATHSAWHSTWHCGDSGSGLSATILSVVSTIAAIDAAFWSANLVTLVGSTIPLSIILTYFSLRASKPMPFALALILSTITEPSSPALAAICLTGSSRALSIIVTPVFSSPVVVSSNFDTSGITFTKTVPPPATIPSSTAALVAASASSILMFLFLHFNFSCSSTCITATPPESLASLS